MAGAAKVYGLASGIDSKAYIEALMTSARTPAAKLEVQRSQLNTRLESVRLINTKLLSAQLDVALLKRGPTFAARSVASSNTAISATATSDVGLGGYSVTIGQIAKAEQRLGSTGQADATSDLGASGTFTLAVGAATPKTITIAPGGSSLNGLASAINSASVGVTASVINTGEALTPFKLFLQSKTTGAASTISIANLVSNGATPLADVLATAVTQVGQDATASATIGGTTVNATSAGSTFKDLFPGLSVTATATGTATLTVSPNTAEAVTLVKAAITSLNSAFSAFNIAASYNAATSQGGPLFTESSLRRGVDSIKQAMLGSDANLPSSMRSLQAAGITFDQTKGTFELDEAKLKQALADDPDAVSRLFAGTSPTSGGFAHRIDAAIQGLTDVNTGSLGLQEDSYAARMSDMSARIKAIDARLEIRRTRYERQFQTMERLVQGFQSQQSSLTGQIKGFENAAQARAGG